MNTFVLWGLIILTGVAVMSEMDKNEQEIITATSLNGKIQPMYLPDGEWDVKVVHINGVWSFTAKRKAAGNP